MTLIEWYYKKKVRPKVFRMSEQNAEIGHKWGIERLKGVQESKLKTLFTRLMCTYYHPMLETTVFGIDFLNPFGLAAGFDKYCEVFWGGVPACGWGFCEIGGITRHEQPGNDQPRMWRSEKHLALSNFMGFNNPGADEAFEVLNRSPAPIIPLGVNLGKSKITDLEHAAEDYCYTLRKTIDYVDFVTINPSSPNTPGLRSLQNKQNLRELIAAVKAVAAETYQQEVALDGQATIRPVGVKVSPDESDEQLSDIAEVCLETKLSFIIATNTTVDRSGYPDWNVPRDRGGWSGPPLKAKAERVLQDLYRALRGQIPLIGVGGISNGRDLYRRIKFGASLCQAYTAWPFEGPDFPRRCLKDLVRYLKADGFKHVNEAVGASAKIQ